MPTIAWERKDTFKCGEIYGLVLNNEGNALVVIDRGPAGYLIDIRRVPADALPAEVHMMPLEIQMALNGAAVADKIVNAIITSH